MRRKRIKAVIVCTVLALSVCAAAFAAEPAVRASESTVQDTQEMTEEQAPDGAGAPPEGGAAPADGQGGMPGGAGQPPGGRGGGQGGGRNGEMPAEAAMAAEESGAAETADAVLGFAKEYATPIISVLLLAAAFVFVVSYKRKRY